MKFTKEQIKTIYKNPGIYLITNLINGKNYVGQAINLEKRLTKHLQNAQNNTHFKHILLYKAMNKYGIENFEFKIIKKLINYETYSKEQIKKALDKLETYYIEKYDSYGENGYNQTKGGDYGVLGLKMTEEQKEKISQNSKRQALDGRYTIYCLNIKTKEITKSLNMSELSKVINIPASSIRDSKCHKRILKETYYFSTSENILNEYENLIKYRSSKNKSGTKNDSYLIEYYNYLINLNKIVTIEEIVENLKLSKEAVYKRNQKLRELGYTLPIKSHNKIKYIEVIDVLNNTSENLSLEEISIKFSISIDSARKQIKRENIYKKQYKFNIIYE